MDAGSASSHHGISQAGDRGTDTVTKSNVSPPESLTLLMRRVEISLVAKCGTETVTNDVVLERGILSGCHNRNQ